MMWVLILDNSRLWVVDAGVDWSQCACTCAVMVFSGLIAVYVSGVCLYPVLFMCERADNRKCTSEVDLLAVPMQINLLCMNHNS